MAAADEVIVTVNPQLLDKLIRLFKDRLDVGEFTLTAAVELSYLSEDEQVIVAEKNVAINEKTAKSIRAVAGELTEDKLEEILHPVKTSAPAKELSVKIPAEAEKKYFSIITTDAYDVTIMSRNTGHY